MYKGFNLNLEINSDNLKSKALRGFVDAGKERTEGYKKPVESILNSFSKSDNTLNGSAIQDYWFPQLNADVFLSHSAMDREQAFFLVGFLKEVLNLNVFVDSLVWLHSDDLLRKLDDELCYDSESSYYIYKYRNHTTAHVHMMLATALSQMMDRTECVFFLNTPNSVKLDVKSEVTKSPWIYHELAMTTVLRVNTPERIKTRLLGESREKDIIKAFSSIEYNINLSELAYLNSNSFWEWIKSAADRMKGKEALDYLYNMIE